MGVPDVSIAEPFFDQSATEGVLVYLGSVTDDADGSYINTFEQQRTLFGPYSFGKTRCHAVTEIPERQIQMDSTTVPTYDGSEPMG